MSVNHFVDAVEERLDYFRKEYQMSYAEAIGALEIIKMNLFHEMMEKDMGSNAHGENTPLKGGE